MYTQPAYTPQHKIVHYTFDGIKVCNVVLRKRSADTNENWAETVKHTEVNNFNDTTVTWICIALWRVPITDRALVW